MKGHDVTQHLEVINTGVWKMMWVLKGTGIAELVAMAGALFSIHNNCEPRKYLNSTEAVDGK